ncbi:preprotein translocase subunit YajC [Halomonas sp. 18H]|nr:preprotein translocase subunit YajC [Halomonas sp. 18H]MCW4151487.1 preprotein translocase subunit YajC [Halomonas sp. 18H]
MLWLMILFVVGLVFAPAMWLRPSKRQQRVMGLREQARELGIAVRVESSPLHDVGKPLPAYRWRYPLQQPGPDFLLVRDVVASESLKAFQAGWRWRVEPLRDLPASALEQLGALLAELPEDAVVVESGAACVTLWWDESGSTDSLARLDERISRLRDQLAGRPDYPGVHQGPPAGG